MDEPTIELVNDRLAVGDSCFVRAEGDPLNERPFVAKILKILPDAQHGGYEVVVNWYYRPDDAGIPGGRRSFHGERELYKSNHRDVIHSHTILGRCLVHTLDAYRELTLVRPQDYFARYTFDVKHKKFGPDRVHVYCVCQLPDNPDIPMAECSACKQWFHPVCCGTTLAEVEALPHWRCPRCAAVWQARYTQAGASAPPAAAAPAAPGLPGAALPAAAAVPAAPAAAAPLASQGHAAIPPLVSQRSDTSWLPSTSGLSAAAAAVGAPPLAPQHSDTSWLPSASGTAAAAAAVGPPPLVQQHSDTSWLPSTSSLAAAAAPALGAQPEPHSNAAWAGSSGIAAAAAALASPAPAASGGSWQQPGMPAGAAPVQPLWSGEPSPATSLLDGLAAQHGLAAQEPLAPQEDQVHVQVSARVPVAADALLEALQAQAQQQPGGVHVAPRPSMPRDALLEALQAQLTQSANGRPQPLVASAFAGLPWGGGVGGAQ